ncbi:MAG: DUF58 domain-containing protein [Planctomycetes bacterium]|nr:DUF58 domain-containing protein [Planctomycetota bacterium]
MNEPYAELLDPAFRARLERLQIAVRRALPSSLRGDRRSPTRKGLSLEFADFRPYAPGDDVRHLDWSAWARLDQLILKLFHDEEDLQVHLLVDDSASMAMGPPEKALAARRVAAALAWIGLRDGSRVSCTLLGDKLERLNAVRGEPALARVLAFLSQPALRGKRPLHEGCTEFANFFQPHGVVVLVSDLLDPAGVAASLKSLQRRTTEAAVVQLLAPQEVNPDLEGEVRLLDMEDGPSVETTLTPARLDAYRATVRRFIAECGETCLRRGAAFASSTTDRPLEDLFLHDLQRAGVLR